MSAQRPQRANISLRDAWPLIQTHFPQGQYNANVVFQETSDELIWNWTNNATYSAKSIYEIMASEGRIAWRYKVIWKCKVPPNVKVFAFLLLTNKILTHEVMMRRGFQCDDGCQTCQEGEVESLLHLLSSALMQKECGIVLHVPRDTSSWYRGRMLPKYGKLRQTEQRCWRGERRNSGRQNSYAPADTFGRIGMMSYSERSTYLHRF